MEEVCGCSLIWYKGLAQSLSDFLGGETSYEDSYSRGWRMLFSPSDFEISKCTCLVGVTDQHAWIQSPLLGGWQIWLHWFEPANFFFSPLFCYERVLVTQFLFFPNFFFPTMYVLVYVQPNLDFNLAWRIHFNDFLDLFLVLGMTLYILKMTPKNLKC